jgi:hypothetical protein
LRCAFLYVFAGESTNIKLSHAPTSCHCFDFSQNHTNTRWQVATALNRLNRPDLSRPKIGVIMSGSISPLSTAHGLPSPRTPQESDDDIYVEESTPSNPAMPHHEPGYDRKDKGKARQRSSSRSTNTPRWRPLQEEDTPASKLDAANQAYLSPPLTSSDTFLLGVHNLSQVLRRGLSSMDFDVDLDLQSGGSSPGGRSTSTAS